MPKSLSPEQLSDLQANGVIIPGYGIETEPSVSDPTEAGAIFRALGGIGLPHGEIVGRVDESDPSNPTTSVEGIHSESLRTQYFTAWNSTKKIMDVVGESLPGMSDRHFTDQLARLEQTFSLFERLKLEPEVVLAPTGRDLTFWEDLFGRITASPLNPSHGTGKLLRDGGLWVSDPVKNNWSNLVKPEAGEGWNLSVVSAKAEPHIVNVTGYGYGDEHNTNPHVKLNELLGKLGLPLLPIRVARKKNQPLAPPNTQPDIHPRIDTYAMHQLNRIVQGKDPLDVSGWSWLKGMLPDGLVPAGRWRPDDGQFDLRWDVAGGVSPSIGVRASGRGQSPLAP